MRQGSARARAVVWLLVVLIPASTCLAGPPPGRESRRAPLPDERLGIRTAPLLLLSRPDVCSDLGLVSRQVDDAETAISDLYLRAAALKGKTGAQAVAMRKAIDEAQRQWFEAHLTPEQLNRLVQIDLQWEGPSALISRPVVADAIRLTPEQRVALKQAVAARDAARLRGPAPESAEQVLARQALSLLSPDQKDRWGGMLGKPFAPQVASKQGGGPPAR